ncbi:hypothetical protein SAMD00019534_009750, partial [Acytostelium subglobosum LB1]|uniref:hypothetical protein n=1 Tax=Acytostelium subglobosum LB1 TaxID=1410327 RepID=UPI00064499C9
RYFTQLTRGCNETIDKHSIYCCHNPQCTKILDPNVAAVKSIEYANKHKDQYLCMYMMILQQRDDIIKTLSDSAISLSKTVKNNPQTNSMEILKPYVFLLQNPLVYDLDNSKILEYFCVGLTNLDTPLMNTLGLWLLTFSKEQLIQLLTNFEQFISVRLVTAENIKLVSDIPIIGACAFLELLCKEYLVFQVRREHIINDALNNTRQIQRNKTSEEMKKELKIQFKGEDGIDQGGVQKEFFQIVVRKIFDTEFGMFIYNDKLRTWWFNPNSLDKLEFELIGIILGLALYNNIILDVHFPLVVYKKLLGIPVSLEDVESIEPEIYQSLITLRDTTDDVSEWMTYFSVTSDSFGETKTIELKPGGDEILVTNSNRQEYLKLYTKYLLDSSISKQWDEFYKGFKLVCDSPLLQLLRSEELEDLICGVEDLDFKELEKITMYDGGYTHTDQTIVYFWETVHAFSNDMKRKFLSFSTGCDRVPYGGLSKIQFSIHKQIDSDRLPSAHTCFNALILPCYPTKEKLEERLSKALNNSEGFGLK